MHTVQYFLKKELAFGQQGEVKLILSLHRFSLKNLVISFSLWQVDLNFFLIKKIYFMLKEQIYINIYHIADCLNKILNTIIF